MFIACGPDIDLSAGAKCIKGIANHIEDHFTDLIGVGPNRWAFYLMHVDGDIHGNTGADKIDAFTYDGIEIDPC